MGQKNEGLLNRKKLPGKKLKSVRNDSQADTPVILATDT